MDVMKNMRFPQKLYCIVSDDRTDSIQWTNDGKAIVIEHEQFAKDYLQENGIFKTKSIASFIRQLNLYGFRKERKKFLDSGVNHFAHELFVRDGFDQIDSIKRTAGKKRLTYIYPRKKLRSKVRRKVCKRPYAANEPSTDKRTGLIEEETTKTNEGGSDASNKENHPNNEQNLNIQKEVEMDDNDSNNASAEANCLITSSDQQRQMNSESPFLQTRATDKKCETEETSLDTEYFQEQNGFSSENTVENMQKGQNCIKVLPDNAVANPYPLSQTPNNDAHVKETLDKSTMTSPISFPSTIQSPWPYIYMQENTNFPIAFMPQSLFIPPFVEQKPSPRENGMNCRKTPLPSQSVPEVSAAKPAMEMNHKPQTPTELIHLPETSTIHTPDATNLTSGETTSMRRSPYCINGTSNGTGAMTTNPTANLEFQGIQPRCVTNENGTMLYVPHVNHSGCPCFRDNNNILGVNTYGNDQLPPLPTMLHPMHQNDLRLPEMRQIRDPSFSAERSNGGVGSYIDPSVDIHQQYSPYPYLFPYHVGGNSYYPYDNMAFR